MTVELREPDSGDARRPGDHRSDEGALVGAIDALLEAIRLERSVAQTEPSRDLAAELGMALLLRRRGVLMALALLARTPIDPRSLISGPGGGELGALEGVPPETVDALRGAFSAAAQDAYPWSLFETLQWLRDDVAASPSAAIQRLGREPRLVSALYATCTAVLRCAIDVRRAEAGSDQQGRATT